MKQIQANQPFTVKVPNSRMMTVQGDFRPNAAMTTEIVSGHQLPSPTAQLIDDGVVQIWFHDAVPITTRLEIVIRQNALPGPVVEYKPPDNPKSIEALQFKRGEIIKSQSLLYPKYGAIKALTFDQSYYTRTVGQCQISTELEDKHGPHHKNYQLISGVGFGAVQAASAACGIGSRRVCDFLLGDLRSSLKKGILTKSAQIVGEIAAGMRFDRMGTGGTIKALQRFFLRPGTKNDLTVKDCVVDLFIPVMDINGRAMAITRTAYPAMPLWLAVACSMLDPLWFDTKPMIKGFSVLTGNVHKTVDILLDNNSPNIQITSIGAPVRIYDHGKFKITREGLALRLNDQKHSLELREGEQVRNRTRHQCRPIDEIKQFDFSDAAVDKAIKSGTGV
jgi:hypothetical protein